MLIEKIAQILISEGLEQSNKVRKEGVEMEKLEMEGIFSTPCLIGLRQQGKFDAVTKMLYENKTWKEIGKAIGWCPIAAKEWYERERER